MEKLLLEALQSIEKLCDNQNPTHENIWAIAYAAIETYNEQKLQQHGVSGKRPVIIELLKEFYTNNRISPEETADKILAACASGAVGKTVCEGTINTEGSNKKRWSENDDAFVEM